MITVPGYTVMDLIYRGASSTVYRGYSIEDKRPVVIKVFNNEYPSHEELAKIRREYEIAKSLNLQEVLRPVDLVPFQQSYILILEDFGGISVDSVMAKHRIDLLSCMKIALSLADTVGNIHQKGIIHKDIKPSNVIINKETGQTKLTDFSVASRFFGERQTRVNPGLLEGTLAYISPEQTGRMNRSIDPRADLYSLGVTLYEMLTGVLPFETTDAMELIHCHMAIPPKPPAEHDKKIPQVLSGIVIKLLAKNAEERYRSAFGLKHDLEKCLIQFADSGTVEQFALGEWDIPTTLQIPEKLYGREEELAGLMSSFLRAAGGKTEIIMVSGPPGIGKSVLINELHKPITEQRGYFASGKFDQFKRDVPYNALRQAFKDLTRHLLGEQTLKITEWQKKIQAALGPNGQIITDLIPEMKLIIGKQPPIEPLPPAQSQNRFNTVLTEFVKVFAQKEHPLVLFLDDVQWADWATLKFMELLANTRDINSLLVIGAYRDNEVSPAHPLMMTLNEITKTGGNIREIKLRPLPVKGIINLISDTLACTQPDAEALADVVMTKTHGNPFFINQFLRNLYHKQMISFDTEKYSWVWDVSAIKAADITSNVVEFMCSKIQELSPAAQGVLTIAACIGNRFNLDVLAKVSETTIADTAAALSESQQEGLLVPLGTSYKYIEQFTGENAPFPASAETGILYMFLHDRIQQAAYSLIPGEQKEKLHHEVGRILLEHTPAENREQMLFEIVQHLNKSTGRIINHGERTGLAALNLQASIKAKAANAYDTARQFAGRGAALLRKTDWRDNYELCRDLSLERAECDYLVGSMDEAEKVLESVLENVRTNEEKAQVYDLKSINYALLGNLIESVRAGLAGMKLLGMHIPENPGKPEIFLEFGKAFLWLRGRRPEALLDLPEMTDEKQKMVIRLLMNTISSAYLTSQNLFAFLCLRGFYLTLRHGVTDSSPFMLNSYAFAIADNFGSYKSAYDFGRVSFSLNERLPSSYMKSKITAIFSFFYSHWRRPIKEGIGMVKDAFRYTVEVGDHVFAGYSSCTLFLYLLASGKNIDEIITELKSYEDFAKRVEDQFSIDFHKLRSQLLKNLKGLTPDRLSMSDNTYDERRASRWFRDQRNSNLLFHYHSWKGLILFLNDEFSGANKIFNAGKLYAHGVALLPSVGDYLFYHTLAMSALYTEQSGGERLKLRKALRKNLRILKKWANNCPENFSHKYFLAQAETARIRGRQVKAINLFNRAVASAREYGFVQVEALANEFAARFHLSLNREPIGLVYMQEARKCYQKWGAKAKVEALTEKYGLRYFAGYPPVEPRIDLATVLRASQTISESIVLGSLLKEIMHIAIQNAGAQKGFLILPRDSGLFIEAEGYTGKKDVEVLQSVPLESSYELAAGIVNYVERTKETVVLQNASEEGLFISDPYVLGKKPKSILCIPILKQKKLSGILYLENDLLTEAFTRDRIEVLSMLAAQAAISLENAKLYEDVEQRVTQLQQAEAKIKGSLKEKEVLIREIHHRVKNNMQIISSLLRLQSRQISDRKDLDLLKESQNRIKAMSLIHEKLFESKDLAHINLRDYISDLTKIIFRSYGASRDIISLTIEAGDIWLGIDTVIPCGLIINELVSNSLKYAFTKDKKGGEIRIAVLKTDKDEIELTVSDNGIGIPEGLDYRTSTSLGLRLVTTLSEDQLRGKIEYNTKQGTEFHIRFKEIKYKERV